jgi:hypothetical protein
MLGFVIMFVIVTGFTRIYIKKFDVKGKNVISVIIGFILTGFLNIIQLLLNGVLGIIF